MTEPTAESVSAKTPPSRVAVEAVLRSAAECGVDVGYQDAHAIAERVLASYETVIGYRMQVPRQTWEITEAREHMIEGVHRKLLDEALSKGYIPAALPKETRHYYVEPWGEPGREVPAEIAEKDPHSWLSIVVEFTMPVRRAP